MPAPVVHFEVNGTDLKKLTDFYATVFGWRIDEAMPGTYALAYARDGDKGIDGGIGAGSDPGTPNVVFYMEVSDPQATLDQVVAAGGSVVVPVADMGMVTYALFADPEGHVLGIVKAQP